MPPDEDEDEVDEDEVVVLVSLDKEQPAARARQATSKEARIMRRMLPTRRSGGLRAQTPGL
jgi:hypothetical protein